MLEEIFGKKLEHVTENVYSVEFFIKEDEEIYHLECIFCNQEPYEITYYVNDSENEEVTIIENDHVSYEEFIERFKDRIIIRG